MKSILSKKYSIFVACIAVIAAAALFGSALTLSVSGKGTIPDQILSRKNQHRTLSDLQKMGKPEIEPQQYRPLLRKKKNRSPTAILLPAKRLLRMGRKAYWKRRRPRKRSALRRLLRRPTLLPAIIFRILQRHKTHRIRNRHVTLISPLTTVPAKTQTRY